MQFFLELVLVGIGQPIVERESTSPEPPLKLFALSSLLTLVGYAEHVILTGKKG